MSDPTEVEPIEVTVLGGYLGAGKTTLLNELLRGTDEPIGVLVNDFGEVNIDIDLIESHDGDTINLANGCICCSLVDGFAAALDQVLGARRLPKRLLIEASGVAEPASVAAWAHRPGLRLDAVLVLAALDTIGAQLQDDYVGDTVARQLDQADLIVATKADRCSDPDAALAELDRFAAPVTTERSHGLLFGTVADPGSRAAVASEQAEATYRTEAHEWAEPVDRVIFDALVAGLGPAVVRAKGIVRFADAPDERVVIQRVGHRLDLQPGGPWPGGPSRLVTIEVTHDRASET